MKRILLFALSISVVFFISFYLYSCKGEDSDNEKNNEMPEINQSVKTFKFKNRLFSIPSPSHVSDLIKDISTEFNEELLNPTTNKLNYSSTEKKALNLGVYTADLGYTNIYEQFSATTKYIKVVRSLSSDLQIMNSYTNEILSEIEQNIENNDSLNKIFTEAYREADLYLTDNNRENSAILIITGGWVEGLYLMTQIARNNKNKLLLDRIGEQKYSLDNLLKLLAQLKTDNKIRDDLLNQLFDLQLTFEKIIINYTYDKHIVLPNEKKTIVISNTEILINDNILKEITKKTEKLRNSIIK
ncbi:MAG: hypothetical protein L3J35_11460 [Bacteroidales bacterium]|nr:hypothetical protein [Bacteroidales bacterium]